MYAVEQTNTPKGQIEMDYEWAKPLPKPEVKDGYSVKICSKCNGNGKYVMSIINGQPFSFTGTTCYKCNGKGWIVKEKKPRTKKSTCPRCGFRGKVDEFGKIEKHSLIMQVDSDFIQRICE